MWPCAGLALLANRPAVATTDNERGRDFLRKRGATPHQATARYETAKPFWRLRLMARPAKRLIDHVRESSFVPSRHAHLLELEGDQLPHALRPFADRYRAARSQRERGAIA